MFPQTQHKNSATSFYITSGTHSSNMEHSGCEINRSERNSTNGDTRSSLGFGVFNPRTFNQDIKFYPNDNLLSVGAQSPVKAESRSRSWSVADTKTVFSTDSDNSDCSREVGNRFSASNQGEYHNFDCGKFQIDEGASRGPSPFAPPERTDNRWTQQSSPTTCVFSPRDDDKIHPTSLPNVDNLEPTLSSDSAPTGYDSLFPFPPTKSDKFADTFGFAAGIAQLSRNRGESLGESIRQEAPVSQPFFNRIAGPSQRSDIISDRSNEIRFEVRLPFTIFS